MADSAWQLFVVHISPRYFHPLQRLCSSVKKIAYKSVFVGDLLHGFYELIFVTDGKRPC
jgi:hypothetical protein